MKEKNPSISVVIPTYNRAESLLRTLKTLFVQTYPPREILIIDDSTNYETRKLISTLRKKYPLLKYLKKNPDEKGTSRSRNIGIEAAKGDYIAFLDDDITVHKDYLESSLKFFKLHKDANLIQWFAYSDHDYKYNYSKIKNLCMRIFFLGYYEKNTSKVLPSMSAVVPHPLTRDIKTEYSGAGTSVVKSKILKEIRFDEKLTGYALQEDLDFSYSLHKKYQGLYILKDKKLHHYYELASRSNLRKIMFTKFVYLAYLFKKHMPQDLYHLSIFWWSMLGRLILRIPNLFIKPSKAKFEEALLTFQAIFSLLRNFSKLKDNPNYFKTEA